jgi:hypothetical protein
MNEKEVDQVVVPGVSNRKILDGEENQVRKDGGVV